MKNLFLFIIILFAFGNTYAQSANRDSVLMNYIDTVKVQTTSFEKAFTTITKAGINNTEKLTLFYYWIYKNITFDTEGFIKNTNHQTIQQTLISRKGLCYEYDKLLEAACKQLNLPGFSIEGYVKFYKFEVGQTFDEANHVWHAVYIDNKYLLIDLLWACGNLHIKNGTYLFVKKVNTKYFMADPHVFLDTHLPLDPIWQFENKPLSMAGFTSKTEGIDNSLLEPYINYIDSIAKINKLNSRDREIAMANRAYNFNTNNPDIVITTYYNIAVDLLSKKSPTKIDLIHAKAYFTRSKGMMSKTKNPEVQQLLPECERGILVSERKLKEFKS